MKYGNKLIGSNYIAMVHSGLLSGSDDIMKSIKIKATKTK